MSAPTRRDFLQTTAAGSVAASLSSAVVADDRVSGAGERVRVAVMGCNGRGSSLAKTFAAQKNCEVTAICDVDERALTKGRAVAAKVQKKIPAGLGDFRKALDDKSIDALVVAAPDHWHGPATILACAAGKHVYVEKPCSHNPQEGQWMLTAARKHSRVVQHGTQRRSFAGYIDAVEKLRGGALGTVRLSRSWYGNLRGSIGRGKQTPPPEWLDFTLWQGPAPSRPYQDNLLHYNWHWFWHWGTGELGNNGVHSIDISRWGLGVEYPTRVTCGGGRHRYDDDQQTPDTQIATFDFDDKTIVWEGQSWSLRGFEGSSFGMSFHGDRGTMILGDRGWKIYDRRNRLAEEKPVSGGDGDHVGDFLTSIREDRRPNADIEHAHKSTLLCHLGNIAYRTGSTLDVDPKTGRIKNNPAAEELWQREYNDAWQPKV